MDPITAFGVVTGGLQVIQVIAQTIEGLSSLRGKYKTADLSIRSLIGELSTIKAAINQLHDWSRYNSQSSSNREYDEGLDVALDGCKAIMEVLANEVSGLCENMPMDGTGVLGFTTRLRLVWNDTLMQNLEYRLHSQVRALNLLLQACQCQTSTEQVELLRKVESRQIIQKVADDTVSLRTHASSVLGSQADTTSIRTRLSSIGEVEHSFEQTLARSALYQRVQQDRPQRSATLSVVESKARVGNIIPTDEGYSSLDIRSTVGPGSISNGGSDIQNPMLRPDGPSPLPGHRSHTISFAHHSQPPVTVNVRRRQTTNTASSIPPSSSGSKRGKVITALRRFSTKSIADLKSPTQRRASSKSTVATSRRGRRGGERDITTSIDLSTPEGASAPALVKAAQLSSRLDIEKLIENGHDIEARHLHSRRNALLVAAHCGRTEIVDLLIHSNANLDARDATGSTALHLAASRGHQSTLELLLMENVGIDAKANLSRTPLWVAVMNGQLDAVELLLFSGAKINARADNQMTALHLAAKDGDTGIAQILIAKGGDLDARDASMMTALHYACEAGNLDLIDLLIASGANINAPGGGRKTPLIYAAASGHHLAVQMLLKKRASFKHLDEGGMTALHWAAFNGHVEIVEIFKQRQGWLSMANTQGRNALHLAAMNSQFPVVEMLLREKPDLNIRCQSGLNSLHYACAADNREVVQLLLTSGADIEAAADGTEQRPLHLAAATGSTRVLNLLCEKGALLESRDAGGDRALSVACRLGHFAATQKLLDFGSALTLRFGAQSYYDSPLCLAAMGGHLSVVSLLLDRGASVFSKDENGWQPLRYAVHYGHPEVLRILLSRQAPLFDKDCPTGPGLTPENIGFASDVSITDERKRQVAELIRDAMTRQRQDDGHNTILIGNVGSQRGFQYSPSPISWSHSRQSPPPIIDSALPTSSFRQPPYGQLLEGHSVVTQAQELPSTLTDGLPTSRSNTPDHLRGNSQNSERSREPDPNFLPSINQALSAQEIPNREPEEQPHSFILKPSQPHGGQLDYMVSTKSTFSSSWFSPDDFQNISNQLRAQTNQPRTLPSGETFPSHLHDRSLQEPSPLHPHQSLHTAQPLRSMEPLSQVLPSEAEDDDTIIPRPPSTVTDRTDHTSPLVSSVESLPMLDSGRPLSYGSPSPLPSEQLYELEA